MNGRSWIFVVVAGFAIALPMVLTLSGCGCRLLGVDREVLGLLTLVLAGASLWVYVRRLGLSRLAAVFGVIAVLQSSLVVRGGLVRGVAFPGAQDLAVRYAIWAIPGHVGFVTVLLAGALAWKFVLSGPLGVHRGPGRSSAGVLLPVIRVWFAVGVAGLAMTLLAGMWDTASARACQLVGVVSVDLALVILAAVGVDLSIMQWGRTGALRHRMRLGVVWKVPVLVGIAWGGAAILVWVTDGEWAKVAVTNPTVLVALLLAGVTAGAVWYWLGQPVRRWWALLVALLLSAGLWM